MFVIIFRRKIIEKLRWKMKKGKSKFGVKKKADDSFHVSPFFMGIARNTPLYFWGFALGAHCK